MTAYLRGYGSFSREISTTSGMASITEEPSSAYCVTPSSDPSLSLGKELLCTVSCRDELSKSYSLDIRDGV
jgi:hypothetical protein